MGIFQNVLNRFGYVKQTDIKTPRPDIEPRVSQFGFDEGTEAPFNEYDQLRAYNTHAWLYAGVSAISRNIARLPIKLYRRNPDGTRGEQITVGWPVEIMRNPNPWTNQNKLIYGISSFITLVGDAYLEKQMLGDTPAGLYLLQPTMVEIVKDPKYKISAYRYTVNNQRLTFAPNEIIQFTEFNPLSEYYGTSVISPLRGTLIADWYAQAWVKAFFENGPQTSGIFTTPKELDDNLFKRLKDVIAESYTGIRKNHKAMFLDQDIKFTKSGIDPKEADLTPLRDMNVREILAVLGVPRMLVQDSKEASWANADAQLTTFWREKMKPHADSIADVFNHDLFYPFGFEMEFDYSGIEALREDEKILVDMGKVAADTGVLTINEIREKYYKLPPVEWGNEPPAQAAPSPFTMIEKEKTMIVAGTRRKWFPELKKLVKNYLQKQMDGALAGLEKAGSFQKSDKEEIKKGIYDVILDNLSKDRQALVDKAVKMYSDAGADFYKSGFKTLKPGEAAPDFLSLSRKDFIRSAVTNFADEIDKTTLSRLQGGLEKSIANNETMPQIQEMVKGIFEGTEREKWYRADNIARTEMLKLENYSAVQGYVDAGATHKTWVAGGPPNDRPRHTAIDGETVPIDQPFSIGLMFPGDPNAGPEEVCNCRCSIAPSLGE